METLLSTGLHILKFLLFFTPGLFLCLALFPQTDSIRRTTYTLSLTISVAIITGVLLLNVKALNAGTVIPLYALLSLLLWLAVKKGRQLKDIKAATGTTTSTAKDYWLLLLITAIGSCWKIWFRFSIPRFVDTYEYAYRFIGKTVPDIGYYRGMALDRVHYLGIPAAEKMFSIFSTNIPVLEIFLMTWIFLGFLYLIFSEFHEKEWLWGALLIMSIGPIELFHMLFFFRSHSLAYIAHLPLILLFLRQEKRFFWIALLLMLALMVSYYTAAVVQILFSLGCLLALLIKETLRARHVLTAIQHLLRDKKTWQFSLLILILSLHISLVSRLNRYSFGRMSDFTDMKISTQKLQAVFPAIISTRDTLYKDPAFLGLSAIRWQILFFSLCGLAGLLRLPKSRMKRRGDLLLLIIPFALVAYGFLHVNLPTRIFNYFAFFGLLFLSLPQQQVKKFFTAGFAFILITSFFVAKDKRVFLALDPKETAGAEEISKTFTGKIFSDQPFVNQLILQGYYQVTGERDQSPLVQNLFYATDEDQFLSAVNHLRSQHKVDFIAVTRRMEEQYVLMVNYPQVALKDNGLFEEHLNKEFDNGYVKLYSTKIDRMTGQWPKRKVFSPFFKTAPQTGEELPR